MKVLAHRGWWLDPAEKNSADAFRRAFGARLGVETDLRDHNGAVVISHDPPVGDALQTLDDFLDDYIAAGRPGRLALNVKADGLHRQIARALADREITSAFLFDMAVPDAVIALRGGLVCFTRESEFEMEPSFLSRAAGVWMDAFETDWIDIRRIQARLEMGLQVALVSPELHGRPHLPVWMAWANLLRSPQGDAVMLCTDLPDEAVRFFARQED